MIHAKPAPQRKRDPMNLNLTAFIDVVFLLLVFFIVTSGFVAGEGILPATLPGGPREPQPAVPLTIEVSSTGETGYRLELANHPTRPSSFGDLQHMLIAVQDNPAKGRRGLYAPIDPLIVAPTAKVRWQHVVNAYNAAVRAGYANVGFEYPSE